MTDNFPDSVNTGKHKLHKTIPEQQSRDMRRRLDVSRKYIFKIFFRFGYTTSLRRLISKFRTWLGR